MKPAFLCNLTSEPIEMLSEVMGSQASLKMTFYGQCESGLLSLVTGKTAVGKACLFRLLKRVDSAKVSTWLRLFHEQLPCLRD